MGSWGSTEVEEDDGWGLSCPVGGSTPKEEDVERSWDPSAHSDLVCKTIYPSKCSYIWKWYQTLLLGQKQGLVKGDRGLNCASLEIEKQDLSLIPQLSPITASATFP